MSETKSFGWEDMNQMTDRCVIICIAMCSGSRLFGTKLEYEHYPPRTERNKDYQYAVGFWEDIMFIGVSIPKEDKHLADQIAASLGMRLEKEQTLILFDGPGGPKEFPAKGSHIFHLIGKFEGDEKKELNAIFDADLPMRRAHVMENMTVGLTPPDWIDSWLGQMNHYMPSNPAFVQRAVETRPQVIETLVSILPKCDEYDDQMLGLITLCRNHEGQVYVGIIHTHPEVRNYGIASFLIKAAITFCVRRGLGKLHIQSRHAYISKILSHFPPEASSVVEYEILGDDLSIEQEGAEKTKP